jgi:hypothetical protein
MDTFEDTPETVNDVKKKPKGRKKVIKEITPKKIPFKFEIKKGIFIINFD